MNEQPAAARRDRIAEALYQWTLQQAAPGGSRPPYLDPRTEEILRANSLARAEAVLPALQAEVDEMRKAFEAATEKTAADAMAHRLCAMKQGAAVRRAERAEALLLNMVDHDECRFDSRGGCRTHLQLLLGPGERCPQVEAKELLEDLAKGRSDVPDHPGGVFQVVVHEALRERLSDWLTASGLALYGIPTQDGIPTYGIGFPDDPTGAPK